MIIFTIYKLHEIITFKLKYRNYFYNNYNIFNSTKYKEVVKKKGYLFIFELCINNL
jgi:hypothetical protein